MVNVKVIKIEGDATLVEFVLDGLLQRATVPTGKVRGDSTASETTLKAGIPFGDDWVEVLPGEFTITSKRVANALRNRGIWTHEDAKQQPRQVVLALQTAFNYDLSKIFGGGA